MAEPDGIAAKALAALGVSAVRSARRRTCRARARSGGGSRGRLAAARVPLGSGAVATLKGALRSALHLGHNYIGTEHILLGLVDEQDSHRGHAGLARRHQAGGARSRSRRAFAALQASRTSPAQAPRTWIAGRSREKTGMNGTCFWVASVT